MLSVEDRQLYDAHYKDRLPMREISKNMQMTESPCLIAELICLIESILFVESADIIILLLYYDFV